MKGLTHYITRHLSLKLGLAILLVVAIGFLVSATILFNITRGYVKEASIIRATEIMGQAAARMKEVLPSRSVLKDDSIEDVLKQLSQIVTPIAPYPHSSSILIDRDGTYLFHPDSSKVLQETIFSDADPRAQEDIVLLGQAMIDGKTGMQQLIVDGQDAYLFYQPIGNEGMSMAIVCPESDVFGGYNQLVRTVWILIALGLLLILVFCYQTIRRAVVPLRLLERQARYIAGGDLERTLPKTTRSDTIGQLQNSFVEMQQSLVRYVDDVCQVNEAMEQRNQELVTANELVRESAQRTTDFLQDMMHQIRTPLNIISGFVQVLDEDFHNIPDNEVRDIVTMIRDNAKKINRIVTLLLASSEASRNQSDRLTALKRQCEPVTVAALCREVAAAFKPASSRLVKFSLDLDIPNTLTIYSVKDHIKTILEELLDNANKFTQQGHITLACSQPDSEMVAFTVSDTGIGIAADDQERIFTQFMKANYFTEGVGLGLSLSKQTAQMLGGDLLLDTTYHDGARFILKLKN